MTGEFLLACGSALWIGLLTAVSPCPLTTNVAAVSYIAGGASDRRSVLLTGLLYAAGRAVAYVAVAALLLAGIATAPDLSTWLQYWLGRLVGPLLVLVGMALLDMLPLPSFGSGAAQRVGERARRWGPWGGLALGAAFALSFCPVSAALFFGTLLPLSLRAESAVLLPTIYGIGTAVPVVGFAVLLAVAAGKVSTMVERVRSVEGWARTGTGWLLVLIGIGLTLVHVFGLTTP